MKKYTSKSIREVLEKVNGIAFSNGKANGIGWQDYRIENAVKEIRKLLKDILKDFFLENWNIYEKGLLKRINKSLKKEKNDY